MTHADEDLSLGADALSLVHAGRAEDGPPPDAKTRVRTAIGAAIAVGAVGAIAASTAGASTIGGVTTSTAGALGAGGGAAGTSAAGAWSVGTGVAVGAGVSVLGKVAVITLAIATVGTVVLVGSGTLAPNEPERGGAPSAESAALDRAFAARELATGVAAVEPETPSDALPAEIVEGETPAISEARVALEPAAPSGAATRDRARSAVTASALADPVIAIAPTEPATSTLADELAILRAGRRALSAGDAEGALEHVSSHTRRFPAGAMAEDRDRLLIEALCRLGRTSDAEHARDAFLRDRPGSVHAGAVRGLCGE